MPEQTQKLIHFTDNVLKAASRESEELNRQLENQRNAVLDEAKKTAWENAKAYYNREAAKLRAEAGREVSKHLMEGKRQVYLRRSQVAQEVLAQVRQRVDEFVASPAYPEHLKTLLARAMERLDDRERQIITMRFGLDGCKERTQREVADELGTNLPVLSMAWILQHPEISCVIAGASKPSQLENNMKAAGFVIPADAMAEIDKITGFHRFERHVG